MAASRVGAGIMGLAAWSGSTRTSGRMPIPEHIHQFHVSGHDLLRLAMHKMEKNPLPRWRRWTIDGDDNPPTAGPLQTFNKRHDLSGEIGDVVH
jgi:hypothetical protein